MVFNSTSGKGVKKKLFSNSLQPPFKRQRSHDQTHGLVKQNISMDAEIAEHKRPNPYMNIVLQKIWLKKVQVTWLF